MLYKLRISVKVECLEDIEVEHEKMRVELFLFHLNPLKTIGSRFSVTKNSDLKILIIQIINMLFQILRVTHNVERNVQSSNSTASGPIYSYYSQAVCRQMWMLIQLQSTLPADLVSCCGHDEAAHWIQSEAPGTYFPRWMVSDRPSPT